MKKVRLKSTEFRLLIKGFSDWLAVLNYSEVTVYNTPKQVKEFLEWLENKNVTTVQELAKQHFVDFMEYFKNRPNKRTKVGLSAGHINKQINALKKLVEYLTLNNKINFSLQLKTVTEENIRTINILSKKEIKSLYEATDNSLIGIRDRAMLAVYYGCGLRRSEGLFLTIDDVLFHKKQLHIRKAKNGYERYVPVAIKGLQDLENYIYSARPLLLATDSKNRQLFISERGKPMFETTLNKRLESIKNKSNLPTLRNKTFGLHTLRHSIATHLLEAGMKLENIALFLGHKSLDSTQIYTHLIHEKDV